MIETGKILQQRYRIEKQIGQGGMGAVYIATDERFASKVAIKETLYMDDSYRKAIEREARLLNSLKHNALPRVSDHFEEESRQFLVMEYIPGEDLGVMMDRDEKPFDVEQVLVWADQLLEALDFLHNQQIPVIHRDIKPQNLKITSRGQIVLLDFGLAKGNPTDAGHQTAAKSIFGYSRNYASLEQIQGTGTDPRSDLYSLAATLYHLLTLVPPEDALTRAMNVLGGNQDPLVPANAIRPEIPPGVAAVLQQALDLNAAARPATASEMRQMLAHHEDYADRLHAAAPATVGHGDITTHKTKLMPEGTRQGGARLTDVKTEILPEYISEETSVRPLAATNGAAAPVRRGRFFRNASAAILILAGLAAGTVYMTNPQLFGTQANPIPVQVIDPVEEPLPEIPTQDSAVNSVSEMANSETAADKQTQPQTSGKTAQKSAKSTGEKQPEVSVGDITVDGETVHIGNMTVRNGRVETPGGYLDENGVWRKFPVAPKTPRVTPPTVEQWRFMTPEQRRKLRILLRKQNMRPPVPDPDETPEP